MGLIPVDRSAGLPGILSLDDSLLELLKQTRRQHAIVDAATAGNRSQVVSGPRKAVQFVDPKPLLLVVEPELTANFRRHLDRRGGIRGTTMGDRRYDHPQIAILITSSGDDNCARSVL